MHQSVLNYPRPGTLEPAASSSSLPSTCTSSSRSIPLHPLTLSMTPRNTLPSQNFSITPTSAYSAPHPHLLAPPRIHANQLRNSRMNTNTVTNSDANLEVDGVNSDADAGFEPAPPAYTYHADAAGQKSSNSGNRRPIFKLPSIFSSCLGRSRSKLSPPSVSGSTPPPYVSREEIDLMQERIKQLDIFFGGASL